MFSDEHRSFRDYGKSMNTQPPADYMVWLNVNLHDSKCNIPP